jgi:hypothetical protein
VQQRQLRLGDILDDYCPRERRVTNHVIVAMIADDVKQVRCTTCDADHDFKHAKVPRQRRKTETPAALYAQVLAAGPKRVTHEARPAPGAGEQEMATRDEDPMESADPALAPVEPAAAAAPVEAPRAQAATDADETDEEGDNAGNRAVDDGPIHRRLIRASLPKIEGAPPPTRAIPEFTIRQPAGRPGANRFRGPRRGGPGGGGGGQQFQGNRSGGGGSGFGGPRGAGGMRSNGGRPPQGPGGGQARRNGPGRRRPK